MDKIIFVLGFMLVFSLCAYAQETLTITTFYPSPSGSYNQLQANSLGVGDNDNNGVLDIGDVPPVPAIPANGGEVWIRGNVGMGTIAPLTRLHAMSFSPVLGRDSTMLLQATDALLAKGGPADPANRSPGLSFAEIDGTPIGALGMAGIPGGWTLGSQTGDFVLTGGNNRGNNIVFGTAPTTAAPGTRSTARMIITPVGNVGIGTTNPLAILHIVAGRLRLTDGVIDTQENEIYSTGAKMIYTTAGWHSFVLNSDAVSGPDYFSIFNVDTTGTPLFRVTDSGNVGIGTAAPAAMLQVTGDTQVDGHFNYQQRDCYRITYSVAGDVMCNTGYYAAGIWDDGGGMGGPNGLVCCR